MSQGKVVIMDSEASLGATALEVSTPESVGATGYSPNPRLRIEDSILNEIDLQDAHFANGSKRADDDDMEEVDRLRPPSRADSQVRFPLFMYDEQKARGRALPN